RARNVTGVQTCALPISWCSVTRREADYYVDMRRVTLHHEAAPLIGHLLLDRLEEEGMGVGEIDAVGGLTLGADPVACAVQHAAADRKSVAEGQRGGRSR